MSANPMPRPAASFGAGTHAVVITDLAIAELPVVSESRRWSTGVRGEAVDVAAMSGVDLTAFVTQAITIGASAITAAGNAQDTFDLERLITEVGTRTTESSAQAADLTSRAVGDAAKAVTEASDRARKAITDADEATRRSFEETVSSAQKNLRGELQRLFGGDNPELLERLQPLLEKFGSELDAKVGKQTSELLAKAARQFDPTDPTSPMARHTRELGKQQEALTLAMATNHEVLATKVEALTMAVKVQSAAHAARTRTASVTPLKGHTYADAVHAVMQDIASGLGDEYADTGAVAGRLPRNKKGDGVLTVDGGAAHVVLEMTDSPRTRWNDYLDEAERNREAAASLGLVRDGTQNAGQSIRVLGARRIVMAFDPAVDDANLLRTVVMLLRTSALAASNRSGADEIATAEEKVGEAMALLSQIDDIQKTARTIHKSAARISDGCDTFTTTIQRLLSQAIAALSGLQPEDVVGAEPQAPAGAA